MSDDTPTSPPVDPVAERRTAVRRALARHAAKLARKLEALRGDLAEAERGPEWQRMSDALYAYMAQVPARSAVARLPDPHAPDTTLEVPLDPAVTPAVNAARYAKRAAKAQRGLSEIPPRITAVTREHHELTGGIELARLAHEAERAVPAGTPAPAEVVAEAEESHLRLERVLAGLSEGTRRAIRAPEPLPRRKLGLTGEAAPRAQRSPTTPAPQKGGRPPLQGKFVPWRYRTREGWDVLIGRSSEANDHLTLHLARPEDYWFHAHGCPGSHVVLRRGKGANEPSKATLEEVAAWAAFHSKSRNAGKVPVIWTQKKYVRKPRGAKAGTVYVEREKMIMVRPVEPPRDRMADAAEPDDA